MELTDPWQAQNIKMLPKVLKHNCFIALILMHLLKVTIWLFFYSEWYKRKHPSLSQYSLNSLKHQFVGSYNMQFLKNFTNTISYRYAERIAEIHIQL
jgi:iron complex outermembrane receptor protein